jgi:hypothetical protein
VTRDLTAQLPLRTAAEIATRADRVRAIIESRRASWTNRSGIDACVATNLINFRRDKICDRVSFRSDCSATMLHSCGLADAEA